MSAAAAAVLDNRAAANRENSLHSTGPVTTAGKAKSSMNSFRHGLTSRQIVLPGEDAEEYDALRENTIETYEPANGIELVLVEELAAASWRLMRVRGQETAILQKLLGDKGSSHAEFATLFLEKPKDIARLTRYITTIERAYYRALSQLEKIQAERKKAEYAETVRQSLLASVREQKSHSGFVSQNSAAGLQIASPAPASKANTAAQHRRS